ncbi:MAG: hypothetical protein ABIO70_22580 [Pseudomonadota bacterium]
MNDSSPASSLQRPASWWLLALALTAYFLLLFQLSGFGVVGEVAAAWTWGPSPRVAVALDGGEPVWSDPTIEPSAGSRLGPLVASQSRPTERLQIGEAWLPLAVNAYTGGLADWPARAAHALTGSASAVLALTSLFGAMLLAWIFLLLRRAGLLAAGLAGLVLATDWSFVFYRRVLGGTELLLLAAALLGIAAWRRWRAGQRWDLWLGLALALGLHAKATFACTALAFLAAAALTRRGRLPGPRPRWALLVGMAALGLAPLVVAFVHHLAVPESPRLWSHDGFGMQLSRVILGLKSLVGQAGAPPRESPASLGYLLVEPLAWFPVALGSPAVSRWGMAPRALGWALVVLGAALAWWRRERSAPAPGGDLLRFLSVAVPLQLALLWAANRDLHHLAQASVGLAMLAGLAAARIARSLAPRGGWRAGTLGVLLVAPLVIAGVHSCLATPAALDGAAARTVTARGQAALVALLRRAGVRRLWTSDYDLYGVFEVLAPDLDLSHAWGAASASRDREALTADLLRAAEGGHWLVVRPSAPRIYDLAPDDPFVQRTAAALGLHAVLEESLVDQQGVWARLYRIQAP